MHFKRILIFSFSLFLLFTLVLQSCFAQVRMAGVSEGDWFKYTLTLDYDSQFNMTSEDFPFEDFLVGENVTLSITDVSGTNVTGLFRFQHENGTEYSQTGSVDLVSGEGDLRGWVISADLNAGDSLYAPESNEIINETIPQTYPWGSRETNHIQYSFNYTSEDDYSYLSLDIFWDKETGVATELSLQAAVSMNETIMDASADWIIVESSLSENLPEFTQITFIATIAILTVSILLIKIRSQFRIPLN